ncbi:hypothetical protein ISN45_Aa07g006020, partial [Arabidopsis thaliana x Arabidopsis arenosa]
MPPAWFVCGLSSTFTKLLSFCSLVMPCLSHQSPCGSSPF